MIFNRHLRKYYLRYSWVLLLGIAALFVVDYAQLAIPDLYGMLIDALDPRQDTVLTMDLVWYICKRMFIIVAVMVVGRFGWRQCFFCSAIRVESRMRADMFDHCKDLSQQFYQVNKVGDLMSLFTNDLETINEWFGDGTLMFFDALILGAMSLWRMFSMDWKLTLFALIPMVFMCVIATLVSKYMMRKWEERQEAYGQLSDFSQESFSGIAVVKAFVKESKELLAFRKVNKYNEKVNIEFTRASVLLEVSTTAFIGSVICVIIGYGGYLAYVGRFSVSQLITFISYFSLITWPVMAVSSLIEMRSRCKASLHRIGRLLDTKPDVVDREGVEELEQVAGAIEYRNLSFTYPDGEYESLHDVSFVVEAGQNVGIIGKTGSGKTTLVDLLLRTYNIPDGMLFVDGKDVNDVSIRSLRSQCAYVPQDNFLFSATLKENIAFAQGDGEIEQAAVEKAAQMAAVHDNIVEFKYGYDTLLGERGVTISGGQKQRTSIARALLKNASILILDDSLSAVDTKTEETILNNLREERKGKTTLLIAHRISTVQHMDKILLLDDGEVVAFGTHDALLANCEMYRNMVELQALETEEAQGGVA